VQAFKLLTAGPGADIVRRGHRGYRMQIGKLSILGVGLIGGAVGIAARAKRLAREVVGGFRRQESLDAALEVGAVDSGALDPAEAASGADFVVLGTGVALFEDILAAARDALAPGAVVTDVGSTKAGVVEACERVLAARDDVHFVGSHPLAGSEQRGPRNAPAVELEGSVCVVTRGGSTDEAALAKVSEFWSALGMRVKVLGPVEHDERLAGASHMPHIVAAALVQSVGEGEADFTATGFRDATRIAAGDAELWTEIVEANAAEIAKRLREFSSRLDDVAGWVERAEREKVLAFLAAAAEQRRSMDGGE